MTGRVNIKKSILTGCLMVPVVLIMATVLSFVPAAYQNYKGVCREEGRVLADEELIRRVIEYDLQNARDGWRNVTFPDGSSREVYIIKYNSYEEFMSLNPDCCRLQKVGRLTPLSEKVAGRGYRYIQTRERVRYRDENGKEGSFLTDFGEASVLTNCGHFVND